MQRAERQGIGDRCGGWDGSAARSLAAGDVRVAVAALRASGVRARYQRAAERSGIIPIPAPPDDLPKRSPPQEIVSPPQEIVSPREEGALLDYDLVAGAEAELAGGVLSGQQGLVGEADARQLRLRADDEDAVLVGEIGEPAALG